MSKVYTFKPQLFIINETDRPWERHIVQKVGPIQYRYIHDDLKHWSTMQTSEPTHISLFGIDYEVVNENDEYVQIHCKLVRGSTAKYQDGKIRHWQGSTSFNIECLKPIMNLEQFS